MLSDNAEPKNAISTKISTKNISGLIKTDFLKPPPAPFINVEDYSRGLRGCVGNAVGV